MQIHDFPPMTAGIRGNPRRFCSRRSWQEFDKTMGPDYATRMAGHESHCSLMEHDGKNIHG